ncbi:MAG: hypothetical protein K1Y02_10600 [Candidatus Hydrogenedentes bacterium]|nr:hypothetical protein [Candidatus Hydrogenedentota bacterium]
MKRFTRYALVAILAMGAVTPLLVGCNLLQYQFCINNLTSFDLKEVNIAAQGAPSWGSNDLSGTLLPGGSVDIKGFSPGMYMVRGVFDIVNEEDVCEDVYNNEFIVVNDGLEITTTNICIDYDEEVPEKKSTVCVDIYGAARFEI